MKRKPSIYNIILALILLLIIVVGSLILFVTPGKKTSRKPSNTLNEKPVKPPKPVFRKDGILRFVDAESLNVISTIDIEVADEEHEREQGLMYRDSMAENQGMLFMMGTEEPQAFWMKNTIISIDIIYVGSDRRIVSIHKNCTPYSLDQVQSLKPALYVVEVVAGYTDKYGIKAGDLIAY